MTRMTRRAAIAGHARRSAALGAVIAAALLACGCAAGGGAGNRATVPATAATTAAAPPAATTAPVAKASINGYKRQVKDGEELYCREDAVLGSRVKGRLICYTAIELAERQQAADELLRQARGAVGDTAAPRMDAPRF